MRKTPKDSDICQTLFQLQNWDREEGTTGRNHSFCFHMCQLPTLKSGPEDGRSPQPNPGSSPGGRTSISTRRSLNVQTRTRHLRPFPAPLYFRPQSAALCTGWTRGLSLPTLSPGPRCTLVPDRRITPDRPRVAHNAAFKEFCTLSEHGCGSTGPQEAVHCQSPWL